MDRINRLLITLLFAALTSSVSCRQNEDITTMDDYRYSQLALQGKQLFEKHSCNSCHYVGDESIQPDAPDLTSPWLANDRQFVQTHLRFVQLSEMPPIALSDEEIRLLGYYISELHAATKPQPDSDKANAMCPVCYALVSTEAAQANKLQRMYMEQPYFFECQACLDTFEEAPEVFIMILKQQEVDRQQFSELR